MTLFSVGLDYGTNSVRGLLVNIETGEEVGESVFPYPHGKSGILLSPRDPNLARQHPQDYLDGALFVIKEILRKGGQIKNFTPASVVGIGVDTTGSTPIPVDANGVPLALTPKFADDLAAMVYLWKDHTGHAEAAEITALAASIRPQYLAKCGGTYSSEWFWAKLLRCARHDKEVFAAAFTWVEHADWIPAVLAGTTAPDQIKRGVCAAGHKAMFSDTWDGYPDAEFLGELSSELVRVRQTFPDEAYSVGTSIGTLCPEWAALTGLSTNVVVSVGGFDAHLGAVGSGITPGILVKNIGTSTCDMMVAPTVPALPDIPGLCGIVLGSILPEMYGLEAGQSAVGDIFNWFVNEIRPNGMSHEELTAQAETLLPGESGLLALDWHNGNRTILVDQRLSGLVLGLTLHTTPVELYRAWVEATGFGARIIMDRFEEYGQRVDAIVNCGGIAAKSPLVMQIYADVMGKEIRISRSTQTAALGAAIAGAVAAGAHSGFPQAMSKMTGLHPRVFVPNPDAARIYTRLYEQYRLIHDAFGVANSNSNLGSVMKELLAIRDEVRREI